VGGVGVEDADPAQAVDLAERPQERLRPARPEEVLAPVGGVLRDEVQLDRAGLDALARLRDQVVERCGSRACPG
jgi:hypothetical protein